MCVHHLGTVFAHGLQVVNLTLQKRHLGLQVFLLWINTYLYVTDSIGNRGAEVQKVGLQVGEEGLLWRQLTVSLFPMVLLRERERVMLKKQSFLLADRGGEEVLTSLPLGRCRGGEAVEWPRPPERLSMLGEELTIWGFCPEREREGQKAEHQEN